MDRSTGREARLARFCFVAAIVLLVSHGPLGAMEEPVADPVSIELEVQVALQQARELLSRGESAQAVAALEKKLPLIKGHADYLATLREAYSAVIRDLKLKNQEEQVRQYQKKLRLLDAVPVRPGTNAGRSEEAPPAAATRDPFQQEPLPEDDSDVQQWLREAMAAFESGRFAEAGKLFARIHARAPERLGPRAADWAYCRVAVVVERMRSGPVTDPALRRQLEVELDEAIRLAASKPELAEFARRVRRRLEDGVTPVSHAVVAPAGWTATNSTNFRLLHHLSAGDAAKLLKLLEQQLTAARDRWAGETKFVWSTPCDVYIHPTGVEYRKATGKDPRGWGHATVEIVDGQVVRRRLDFPGDEPDFPTAAIAREVTHLVLADLFPDPPLPRWAEEAIAVSSMPRSYVERYLLALPKVARDGQLLPWDRLLQSTDFPPAASVTAFYVQSVSLADTLIAEKGPRTLILFLKKSQQQGVERALREVYGFRSLNSLHEYWRKKAFAEP